MELNYGMSGSAAKLHIPGPHSSAFYHTKRLANGTVTFQIETSGIYQLKRSAAYITVALLFIRPLRMSRDFYSKIMALFSVCMNSNPQNIFYAVPKTH